jgi:hypothetical protein
MPRFTSSWRVFGAESASFGIFLFLVRLTPTIANLVEFLGKREGELVIGYLELQETILHEILVDFGYSQPSGANGAGCRANRGVVQPFSGQRSLRSHQGLG